MQATLPFYANPPRHQYSDLFYYANFNMAHTNDLKLYKPKEIENTKKLWALEDDAQFPHNDKEKMH